MKTKSTKLQCEIKLNSGCSVFFNGYDECPDGVDHILVRSEQGYCLANVTRWHRYPVQILGDLFEKMITNFGLIDSTTFSKVETGEISVLCPSGLNQHMVIKKSHNGEFTPYVRFVDSDGKELLYYDIEQEMGSSAGYPGCIETVGAMMSVIALGYSDPKAASC